jgi:hypothetical protein
MYGLTPKNQKILEDAVKTFKVCGEQIMYRLWNRVILQEARTEPCPTRGPRRHYMNSVFIDERQSLREIRDAIDKVIVDFEEQGLVTEVRLTDCIDIEIYREKQVSEKEYQKELLAYALQMEVNKALDAIAELQKCQIIFTRVGAKP